MSQPSRFREVPQLSQQSKALSQSDGRWRYSSDNPESSTYAAGLALEALAGVISLASSEIDQSRVNTVKSDIFKLFDSIQKYGGKGMYVLTYSFLLQIRPIDKKQQYQIQKVIKASESATSNANEKVPAASDKSAGNLILNMLLHHLSPNSFHMGRTLLHHTIICNNERALNVLLNNGVDTELALQTTEEETNLYPIHMAARLGLCNILQCLINGNCNLDSQTKLGDTALMVCTRYKHEKCLRVLVSSGADLGIVNSFGHCATSTATSIHWTKEYQKAVLDIIR
ncbi:unnamed protein product [Vicia faba]|uniref:Uncharacterized protein n=1 Tax=Vicia faba TaxID=3906 RepID=A0AAV0ZES1_VICFA|nr:unnamed protein product [Vicia faba]CAI8608157.1 unnamed protein product [Vicia faba]